MNKKANSLKLILSFFIIILLYSMTGCRYLSIPPKDNVAAVNKSSTAGNTSPVYNSAVIKGKIISDENSKIATLIIAYCPACAKDEYTEYATCGADGSFMLYLPEGKFYLIAITDYNHNYIFEDNEVSGLYGSALQPTEISINESQLINNLIIRTSRSNSRQIKLPWKGQLKKNQNFIRKVTHNGQLLKIYHEYFSLDNAQTGYWNPSSFMKAFGAHIYLTDKFDPKKIPVLFVHGTEGSPYNWIYFYMRLDRNLYQPWFFYYPSGVRLNLAASLLNEELSELHNKFGFQKMAIVAHSVGGLTTRSFLNHYASARQNNYITLFVSLATPWSGFGIADASQKMPHKIIPAWLDLGTQSAFIQSTMENALPSTIKHYIFYGKNDNLIGDTALDNRAVSPSVEVLGFDCTHDTILKDRQVFLQFNEILETVLGK
jgi:predicted small lipoprotein YifL